MLKPVKRSHASEQVFEQLRDLIYRGQLMPGDKMPPERELAASFGISRPTVRDALKKLALMGLIEQRQGHGTFVSASPATSVKNHLARMLGDVEIKVDDLLEVRLALECSAASMAAQRATIEDVRALSASLAEINEDIEAGGLGTTADLAFHMAIAYATKNPVHIRIMKDLRDLLQRVIHETLRALYSYPGSVDDVAKQHEAVFQAIRTHDPEAARLAMRGHIRFVCDFCAETPVPPRIL